MDNRPLVTIIIGTRPEAIKLAPVIKSFKESDKINTRIVLTGQHAKLVDDVLKLFYIVPDKSLNIMKKKQEISYITSSCLMGLNEEFNQNKPNLVIVQGDTSTAFSAALAAFYQKIKVAHVEAGLRTDDLLNPYPEELNRRLISQIATIHFAPTSKAEKNLKNSNVIGKVETVGNTVIDSLIYMSSFSSPPEIKGVNWEKDKIFLLTVHRRENWGENLIDIVNGIKKIISTFDDISIVIPMHPNETIRNFLKESLNTTKRIFLVEPFSYSEMIGVLKNCHLVLTDSGGLQEEAPGFGKPVLVLRKTTERLEAIEAGTAKLIGTSSESIFNEVYNLLINKGEYELMSKALNPFGDGLSSKRILETCLEELIS